MVCYIIFLIFVYFRIIFRIFFSVSHWMWYGIALSVSSFLVVVIFFTTRTDRPPKWYSLVAFLSATMSIGLVYITTSEFVSCLGVIFIVMRIGRAGVAVTVMSWGRGLGGNKKKFVKYTFFSCCLLF